MLFRPLLTFCTISPPRINSYSNDFTQNDNVTNEDEELPKCGKQV
jgi:hypothetical protein